MEKIRHWFRGKKCEREADYRRKDVPSSYSTDSKPHPFFLSGQDLWEKLFILCMPFLSFSLSPDFLYSMPALYQPLRLILIPLYSPLKNCIFSTVSGMSIRLIIDSKVLLSLHVYLVLKFYFIAVTAHTSPVRNMIEFQI